MVSAVQKSLGLKVSLTLALVTLVLTSAAAFLITARQTQAMEELTLNKARLAAALGAQTYGGMLEDAIDNGYLTVDEVFDRNYEPIRGYDWAGKPRFHTKYDFYTDRVALKFQTACSTRRTSSTPSAPTSTATSPRTTPSSSSR